MTDHTSAHQPRDLLAEAQRRAHKAGQPFEALLELTHRCNIACRHCYIVPGVAELPFDEWKKILAQFAEAGVFVLTLTGGEPTLHRDFYRILRLATEMEFAVRIFSNFTTFTPQDMDEICRANLLGIETTILGPDAETHDWFCRSKGAFDKAVKAIKFFKERGVAVGLKSVWTRYNYRRARRMTELARELGVGFRASPTVTPRRDASDDNCECRLSEDETFELLCDLMRTEGPESWAASCDALPPTNPDAGFCGAGVVSFRVDPLGKVYPCVEIQEVVGDLRRERLEDIWRCSPYLLALRKLRQRDAKECMDCPDAKFCFRCPGEALNENGSLCAKSSTACMLARARRRVYETAKAALGSGPDT